MLDFVAYTVTATLAVAIGECPASSIGRLRTSLHPQSRAPDRVGNAYSTPKQVRVMVDVVP